VRRTRCKAVNNRLEDDGAIPTIFSRSILTLADKSCAERAICLHDRPTSFSATEMLARLSGFNGKALLYSTHGKIQSSIPARNPFRIIHAQLQLWNTTAYVLRAVQRRTMLQWWTLSSCRSCTSSTPPAGWSNSQPSPVPQWCYGTARSRFSLRHGWAAATGFSSLELYLFTIAGR